MPSGPSDHDPPARGRRGGDRDDDDWGYGAWETPGGEPRADDGRGDDAGAPDGRDARRTRDETAGDADADAGTGDEDGPADPDASRPRRRSAGGAPDYRRRRLVAGAGLGVLLLLVVVAIASLSGGGGGGDVAPASATTRPMLSARLTVGDELVTDRLRRDAAVRRIARRGLPVYCGAGKKPWVALTFDDGPSALSPEYERIMQAAGAPATVFRIGRSVPDFVADVRRERDLGWDSGSHTQNHANLDLLKRAAQRKEIVDGDRASAKALGRPPLLFRPPYEAHDASSDRIVKQLGRAQILWNVDTEDSEGTPTADSVYQRAAAGLKPGSIILMHETKPTTVQALPRILAELKRRGLTAVTVSQMLAGDAPSTKQLKKGFDGCGVDLTPGTASA